MSAVTAPEGLKAGMRADERLATLEAQFTTAEINAAVDKRLATLEAQFTKAEINTDAEKKGRDSWMIPIVSVLAAALFGVMIAFFVSLEGNDRETNDRMDKGFEKIDSRFEKVKDRMDQGFKDVRKSFTGINDRLDRVLEGRVPSNDSANFEASSR